MDVALYLRVSRDAKRTQLEREEAEALARMRGWTVVGVYTDKGLGSSQRHRRPGRDALLADARAGKFAGVIVWCAGRLALSLRELVTIAAELVLDRGIAFVSVKEKHFDTTLPTSKSFLDVLPRLREFQKALNRTFVQAGIEDAQRDGKRIGQQAKIRGDALRELARMVQERKPVREIATHFGVGIGSVTRAIARLEDPDGGA